MEVHSSLIESSEHNIYYTNEIINQKYLKKSNNNNIINKADDDYNDDNDEIKTIEKKNLEKPKSILNLPRFTIVFDYEIHDFYVKSRGLINVQRFFKMLFRPMSARERDGIL